MVIKFITPILLLILGLGTGCKHIQDPEFRRLENFRLKKLGLQQTSVGFSVTYYNPNNFGVSVKEAVAEIYVDSLYLGKFTQDSSVSVAKTSEFSIPLTGNISLQSAMKMDFQNIGDRDIHIIANGLIKVGKAGFYVTKPINYNGNVRLDKIKF
jgi:LEA14-like dessication related protein